MSEGSWNPWKLTAIGMGLVMVTAVVTGMVVANWSGTSADKVAENPPAPVPVAAKAAAPVQPSASPRIAAAPSAAQAPAAVAPAPAAPARPSQSEAYAACMRSRGY
ncbi:MAG: hypothetical protein FJZ38_26560 [Candidatus Rokubacteria bacterium]|nr:hypothetical protein [Candidatus Rokubacteria bacterium]